MKNYYGSSWPAGYCYLRWFESLGAMKCLRVAGSLGRYPTLKRVVFELYRSHRGDSTLQLEMPKRGALSWHVEAGSPVLDFKTFVYTYANSNLPVGGDMPGYCYLLWFRQLGMSEHVIGTMKKRFGRYPRVGQVFDVLLRTGEMDMLLYAPDVVIAVGHRVLHIRNDAGKIRLIDLVFQYDFDDVVGGDSVDVVLGMVGLDSNDMKRKALLSAVSRPDSQVQRDIINKCIKDATDLVEGGGPVVDIPFRMSPPDMAELCERFPEFTLRWGKSVSGHPHSNAAAVRVCELNLALRMLDYRGAVGGIRRRFDFNIKDIGGDPVLHLQKNHVGIHSCVPLDGDSKDCTRRTAMFNKLDRLASDKSRKCATVNWSSRADVRRWMCNRKGQKCSLTSESCMFIHSTYDMTPIEVADCLVVAKSIDGIMTLMYDPQILSGITGFIPFINCRWDVDRARDSITFTFLGDDSLSYVHKYSSYVALVTMNYIVSTNGTFVGTEVVDNRCGIVFIRLTVSMLPCVASLRMRPIWMGHVDDVCITWYDANYNGTMDSRHVVYVRKTIVVPEALWEKGCEYAYSLSAVRFSVAVIFEWLRSNNGNLFVSGVAVRTGRKVKADVLFELAGAIYVYAFDKRFDVSSMVRDATTESMNVRGEKELSLFRLVSRRLCEKFRFWGPEPGAIEGKVVDIGGGVLGEGTRPEDTQKGHDERTNAIAAIYYSLRRRKRLYVKAESSVRCVRLGSWVPPMLFTTIAPNYPESMIKEAYDYYNQVDDELFSIRDCSDLNNIVMVSDDTVKSITAGGDRCPMCCDEKCRSGVRMRQCATLGAEYELVRVPGDGDCCFHAFLRGAGLNMTVEVLKGVLLQSSDLRSMCVADEQRKLLSSRGSREAWGNVETLILCGMTFGFNIRLVTYGSSWCERVGVIEYMIRDESSFVTVAYNGCHYDALIKRAGVLEAQKPLMRVRNLMSEMPGAVRLIEKYFYNNFCDLESMATALGARILYGDKEYGQSDKLVLECEEDNVSIIRGDFNRGVNEFVRHEVYSASHVNVEKNWVITRSFKEIVVPRVYNRSSAKLLELLNGAHIAIVGKQVLDMCGAPGGFVSVVGEVSEVTSFSRRGVIKYDACATAKARDLRYIDLREYKSQVKYDLVLGDAGTDTSFIYAESIDLFERQLRCAVGALRLGGDCIIKHCNIFAAASLDNYPELGMFTTVEVVKPLFSSCGNTEVYFICKGMKSERSAVRIDFDRVFEEYFDQLCDIVRVLSEGRKPEYSRMSCAAMRKYLAELRDACDNGEFACVKRRSEFFSGTYDQYRVDVEARGACKFDDSSVCYERASIVKGLIESAMEFTTVPIEGCVAEERCDDERMETALVTEVQVEEVGHGIIDICSSTVEIWDDDADVNADALVHVEVDDVDGGVLDGPNVVELVDVSDASGSQIDVVSEVDGDGHVGDCAGPGDDGDDAITDDSGDVRVYDESDELLPMNFDVETYSDGSTAVGVTPVVLPDCVFVSGDCCDDHEDVVKDVKRTGLTLEGKRQLHFRLCRLLKRSMIPYLQGMHSMFSVFMRVYGVSAENVFNCYWERVLSRYVNCDASSLTPYLLGVVEAIRPKLGVCTVSNEALMNVVVKCVYTGFVCVTGSAATSDIGDFYSDLLQLSCEYVLEVLVYIILEYGLNLSEEKCYSGVLSGDCVYDLRKMMKQLRDRRTVDPQPKVGKFGKFVKKLFSKTNTIGKRMDEDDIVGVERKINTVYSEYYDRSKCIKEHRVMGVTVFATKYSVPQADEVDIELRCNKNGRFQRDYDELARKISSVVLNKRGVEVESDDDVAEVDRQVLEEVAADSFEVGRPAVVMRTVAEWKSRMVYWVVDPSRSEECILYYARLHNLDDDVVVRLVRALDCRRAAHAISCGSFVILETGVNVPEYVCLVLTPAHEISQRLTKFVKDFERLDRKQRYIVLVRPPGFFGMTTYALGELLNSMIVPAFYHRYVLLVGTGCDNMDEYNKLWSEGFKKKREGAADVLFSNLSMVSVSKRAARYEPIPVPVGDKYFEQKSAVQEFAEYCRIVPHIHLGVLKAHWDTLKSRREPRDGKLSQGARRLIDESADKLGVLKNAGQWIYKGQAGKEHSVAYDGQRVVEMSKVDGRSEMYLVNDTTVIWSHEKIYEKLTDVLRTMDDYVGPQVRFVSGVPGCGKTHTLMSEFDLNNDMIVFPTRESKDEFRERLVRRFRDAGDESSMKRARESKIIRTVDSVLINGCGGVKVRRLLVDEALMVHPGAIFAICHIVGAVELFMIGDVKQIPWICRENVPIKYGLMVDIFEPSEYLCVSRRCTKTAAFLLDPLYAATGGMKTKCDVDNDLELELDANPYQRVRQLYNADSAVKVLTFTQADKSQLKDLGASTINEYQGKESNKIILVRGSQKLLSVYEDEAQMVVALSRHRKKFIYVTPVLDVLAKRVQAGRACVPEKLNKRLDTAGGYIPDDLRIVVNDSRHQDRYPENVLSNVDHVGGYVIDHVDIVRDYTRGVSVGSGPYVPISITDACVETLQIAYDTVLPGCSVRDTRNDPQCVDVEGVDLVLENCMFNPAYSAEIKTIKYETLRPVLRTAMPANRPATQIETLLGLVKRNMAVPKLAGVIDPDTMGVDLWENFKRVYVRDDCLGLLRDIAERGLVHSAEGIVQWLETQPAGTVERVGLEQSLNDMDLGKYDFMIKNKVKPQLDVGAPFVYSAVQTIASQDKCFNALWSPLWRFVKGLVLAILKPQYMIYCDVSPDEFAKRVEAVIGSGVLRYESVFEEDLGKFDKSQQATARSFEDRMMADLGVCPEMLEWWRNSHVSTTLVDRRNKVRADVIYQRKSGDASTFLGNTMFCMAVMAYVYDLADVPFAAFSGDDSLIYGDACRFDLSVQLADWFNLEAKLLSGYVYPSFCSKFLLCVGDSVYFVPDPVKMITKLGRHDLVNAEHVEQYRVSLVDLTVQYGNGLVAEELARAVCDRYHVDFGMSGAIGCIYNLVRDKRAFHSLYYSNPGDNICGDVSLPSLD